MKQIKAILLFSLLILPLIGFSAETVNINTANKQTLMETIKGVGAKKAEAIIQYREENGPFESIDELSEVKGIGPAMIDTHRAMLSTTE